MKTSDIRKMSTEDILKKIEELQNDSFDMKMKKSTAALEKTHMIKKNKKDIARMKTILTERKIQETKEGGNK